MQITGYVSEWTVRPGDNINLHVSCRQSNYTTSVVQLIHGDTNPAGPGFRSIPMPGTMAESTSGQWYDVPSGSYAIVEDADALLNAEQTTVAVWIYPTKLDGNKQAILSRGDNGFCLSVNSDGKVLAELGSQQIESDTILLPNLWYQLLVRIDRKSRTMALSIRSRDEWPSIRYAFQGQTQLVEAGPLAGPLVMAAEYTPSQTIHHFNGKIDTPIIFDALLADNDVAQRFDQLAFDTAQAYWDFGLDHSTLIIPANGERHSARLMGMPMRCVSGHRANGTATRPSDQPSHYTAIHFHDDDKDDAAWPVASRFDVPESWGSGIYAFHLVTPDGEEDYVPFFLLPSQSGEKESIAFLAPTFSYIAYGNVHYSHVELEPELAAMLPEKISAQDQYIKDQKLGSTYDLHSDGSGVAYVSRNLPQINVRPKQIFGNGSPHQLNADLHLIDWLHVKGFAHDVLTDEALHNEGVALLKPYNVVLTGTHPEYWSGDMLDAVQAYLNGGGRIMYMGGNGFYWVTSKHKHAPHVLEVRKFGGTRTWTCQPDERHHSTTGEMGGLWRDRGRAPQKLLGVGFAGQGFAQNGQYRRTAESYTGIGATFFEGISSEIIGDTPSLVLEQGAAGFEVDRIDHALGSPPHVIGLARSFNHGDHYQLAYEDALASMVPAQLGSSNRNMRADIAYLKYQNGGAVFSTGSISYCGTLSYNNYENDVSRLTENVLRYFDQ